MGQMTFDFEADDNEPEESQVKEKTEVKPKLEENKKEEMVIKVKIEEKNQRKKQKGKRKLINSLKSSETYLFPNSLNKIDIF